MVQKTDLNVAPYYDDFDSSKNYVKSLFRPGFAIQARELTQLQSALQNQIARFGEHMFKEGSIVIPGAVSVFSNYHSLKLASTFATETVDPSQYYSATTPVIITGATSGVTAEVVGYDVASTTDQPTLFLKYIKTGTDGEEKAFLDGENISANADITHTTSYDTSIASATTYTSSFSVTDSTVTLAQYRSSTGPAAGAGVAVDVQAGVYFIRGHFVECSEERIVISKYDPSQSFRCGFAVTETLVTPEDQSSLLDNATGSTNYAAKGAHRLQISLALKKLDYGATADSNFIELTAFNNSVIQSIVRNSEYSILEETLARRTYDESGDYTVRPFQIVMKESTTLNKNVGVYTSGATTDDGNISSNALLACQISTGKALVKGYEIEKIAPTFKDINKSRDVENVNAGITTFELGNYTVINNVYGTPDITAISGETTAYKTISLYDHFITTDGAVPISGGLSPEPIGQCRARAIDYDSGTIGTDDARYKIYLFDIKMFTTLTLSGTPSPTLIANFATGGIKITGVDSGATGYVVNNIATTSGTKITVIKTSGRFSNGEKFEASDSAETSSIVEDSSNTDLTLASVGGSNADDTRTFEQVRSMVMVDASAAAQNFTADLIQETPQRRANIINNLTLDGTDAGGANANNTFTQDVGDDDPSGGIIMENSLIPRLVDPEKNNALEKLPKSVVKTLLTTNNSGATDTQYTVRRQFIGTTNASGIVTFNASTNETFVTHTEKDYVMSILTAGGGTGVAGQLVSIADTESGTGTASLTITDSTVLGSAAKVKLTATILKTSVTQKNKTTKLMKQMKVTIGTTDAYGTRPMDRDISLGRADAFKLVGVFDSQDTSTDAVAPTLTLTTITGTFTRGEKITGGTSGATGRIISTSSPMSFVSTNSFSFTTETITGTSSEATATVTATTDGDITITSKYLLDTGQRDNYYDIARIVRKRNQAAPIGRLLVVYDYLEHGAGDMFTVDSYSDIAKQMEYDDIPIYTASKIDVDEAEPSGNFPLYDCYDFRPRVDDVTGASATLSTVDEITGQSFNFYSRTFGGTGGTTVDTPKPGSFIQADFEYYLPKFASLILNNKGDFNIIEGRSAENPLLPKVPDNCMLMATMFIPAYTFLPRNASIRKVKHQRYTMKDIGKLAKRLDHVEYYTALSLLERDAESFEVTDANGLNRFKSGFVVDNFKGHRIGDTVHRDYKNSMDFELGQLRPKHKAKAIDLIESVSTDAARTAAGYQKTGDLITLPYTEVTLTEQPYATRTEKIRPIITSQWMGTIILSPESDTWFETEIIPELVINEEGDYDSVLAQEANNLGSIWNSWQTQWSGVVETRTDNWTEGGIQFSPDRFDVTRTTETVRTDQTRTGVNTQVALRVDRESQGFRVVSTTAIPIVRSRSIAFTGENFKPNTRLYSFFNKTDVISHVTPASTDYTTDATPIAESPLVTTATGKVEGTFLIPDPNVDGNPRFTTGDIEFRLTSSDYNGVVNTEQRPGTAGTAIYSAIGMLETEQETIIATRNATVTRIGVSQETSFNTVTANDVRRATGNWNDEQAAIAAAQAAAAAAAAATRARQIAAVFTGGWAPGGGRGFGGPSGGDDPLAQTFMMEGDASGSGRFITSVDFYHQAKDDVLPVTVEIRNVVNGFPGPKVLPFGRVVKNPADINISDTAATATTYTFPSPVYVEAETEYCIVVMTNSYSHKIWISRMGETDVGSERTISEQPHVGLLFKSGNNRGWSMSPMEDAKFTVKAAEFSTTAGVLALTNDDVPTQTLGTDPLIITDASTTIKVNHPNHHMYATSNNVTISGLKSPATTTLNGTINSTTTTLTLTSGTNFDDTSGIYSKLANNLWYIKIDDEILTYTTISTNAVSGLSRAVDGTTAAEHASGATVELYQAHKVPFTEINKTHTSIANLEIDSYTLSSSTTAVVDGAGSLSSIGGTVVVATENAIMDVFSTLIGILEMPGTSLAAEALVVRATSPSGSQTSFENTRDDELVPTIKFPLNDNYKFEVPYMVCSAINETNELSSLRSFETQITMKTDTPRISPIIDLGRTSMIAVANRINNIDSSSDVYPTSGHVGSLAAEGDENAAIYITKQVTLDNLASGIKLLFAAHRPSTNDIKVMYKILPIDESEDFDNLGYTYFNDDGSPDAPITASASINDFHEYEYTAGVTDEGVGNALQEYISFQIKIIMQGTNCAEPPRIRALRAIALGT